MATSRHGGKRPAPRHAAERRAHGTVLLAAALSFAAAAEGATAPGTLDPSEVITPAELATIPDPVPPTPSAPPSRAPGAAPATAPSAAVVDSAAPPAGVGTWRVQVFASPDLAQAGQVAREASEKLGVPFTIEFEGSNYKVRLGRYASEDEAQALRERALREGYPGAFRSRDSTSATQIHK